VLSGALDSLCRPRGKGVSGGGAIYVDEEIVIAVVEDYFTNRF